MELLIELMKQIFKQCNKRLAEATVVTELNIMTMNDSRKKKKSVTFKDYCD